MYFEMMTDIKHVHKNIFYLIFNKKLHSNVVRCRNCLK